MKKLLVLMMILAFNGAFAKEVAPTVKTAEKKEFSQSKAGKKHYKKGRKYRKGKKYHRKGRKYRKGKKYHKKQRKYRKGKRFHKRGKKLPKKSVK